MAIATLPDDSSFLTADLSIASAVELSDRCTNSDEKKKVAMIVDLFEAS